MHSAKLHTASLDAYRLRPGLFVFPFLCSFRRYNTALKRRPEQKVKTLTIDGLTSVWHSSPFSNNWDYLG